MPKHIAFRHIGPQLLGYSFIYQAERPNRGATYEDKNRDNEQGALAAQAVQNGLAFGFFDRRLGTYGRTGCHQVLEGERPTEPDGQKRDDAQEFVQLIQLFPLLARWLLKKVRTCTWVGFMDERRNLQPLVQSA